jgi:hypothetical protein
MLIQRRTPATVKPDLDREKTGRQSEGKKMYLALGTQDSRRLEVDLRQGFFGWIKIRRLEVCIAQLKRPVTGRTRITIENDPCRPRQAIRIIRAYKMGRLIKFVFASGRTIFVNRRLSKAS